METDLRLPTIRQVYYPLAYFEQNGSKAITNFTHDRIPVDVRHYRQFTSEAHSNVYFGRRGCAQCTQKEINWSS